MKYEKTLEVSERPANASIDELKAMMVWIDECKRLGWKPEDLHALEGLWWKYHPVKQMNLDNPVVNMS